MERALKTNSDTIIIKKKISFLYNQQIHPHISRSSKSTIFSIFLFHFSTNIAEPTTKKKSTTFRSLGCTTGAAQQMLVPMMIRSSMEWE
uniref:Uncharacterized protein n=1 Tax=Manihot esculenta TaxID=3983 RepID=A0A2C9WNW2_MANES